MKRSSLNSTSFRTRPDITNLSPSYEASIGAVGFRIGRYRSMISRSSSKLSHGNGNGNGNEKTKKADETAAEKVEKAAEKVEKAAEKVEKAAEKEFMIKDTVIKIVDEIIEAEEKSDEGIDEVEKRINDAQKKLKKEILVVKVLSKLDIKKLDNEFEGKSQERERIDKINQQLIKDIQKAKIKYFDEILTISPGYTIEKENLEKSEIQEKYSKMQKQKDVGIIVKKIDAKIKRLLQDENPDENAWKFGVDSYKGKTRIVLELSNINPETIEKIQSYSNIEIQDGNLIQIITDIQNIPKINALKEVEKTRTASSLSDFIKDDFDLIKSPFLNSDKIIKTLGGMEYSNLIQLSSDISDLNYITKKNYDYPVSEGVYSINADIVHSFGITGKKIRVAVLDLAFDIDNPKISENVADFKSFKNSVLTQTISQDKSANHGTAVAEIISDVAPDSELYLYEINTDVEFGRAIDEAINNNVDVITMAAGWPNLPTDGTSHITKKIEDAISKGISVIVPSGNFAQRHWEGQFLDDNLNAWHEFAENDEGLSITVSESQINNNVPIMVYLNWDDKNKDYSDFELILVDPSGKIVEYSADTQTVNSKKIENIFFMPQTSGVYALGILDAKKPNILSDVHKYSTLELFSINNNIEYPVSVSSVIVPSDAQGVIVVGAVNNKDGVIEPFSSQGPTNNGKSVPNIVGPNGVTTISQNGNLFYGTSATTPHVAGIVALMLDVNSELTPIQLLEKIQQNAKPDYSQPNYQNVYGFGIIDATFVINEKEAEHTR